MALFFDLGIPYLERDGGAFSGENKAKKDARLRAAVKALELGYAGVAYDRPFRGVMADSDRCKISPFPISSLLKAAPSLASSAAFHRDLLGSPRDSPFRQYSRITLAIDTVAAAASLASSSSNPLLRSYDIVAVRPLNQIVFDHACKFSEIDMISIDFSQKLPFRLKLPLVEAAIKRGLHFEITYSPFIADINVRRQMLSDAKLLVDWTRGKNLIISSAALTANEIRGPYDVINLFAVLLGLSIERAKAAISMNCRSLLVKALRKKHFYKETIRIERILPDEQSDSERSLLGKWICWDPISSGDGDLPSVDDMTKLSSADVPISLKAIDLNSMADGTPFLLSHSAVISSSKNLGASSVANDIPPAVTSDARQQDIVDGVLTDLPTTLMPLEQNSLCETILVPPRDEISVLEDAKEPGIAAEVDGLESFKEECAMVSDADAMQSGYAEFKDLISASGDDLLLSSDANLPCPMVTENTGSSNVCVEGYKSFNQPDYISDKLEAPKDATELMECFPGIIVDRTPLNDNGSSFTSLMEDNIRTEQAMVGIIEQELDDELLSVHDKILPKIDTESTSSGETEGLITFADNMQSKDATKEAKGEANSIENTVSMDKVFMEEEKVVVNSSLTANGVKHYKVKSGKRRQREGLHHPANPLPFRGLLKPMLFKKKARQVRRSSKNF